MLKKKVLEIKRYLTTKENRRIMFWKYFISFFGGIFLGLGIIVFIVWYFDAKTNHLFFIGTCLGSIFSWVILRYLDHKWKYRGQR